MQYRKIDNLVECEYNKFRANVHSQCGEDGVIGYLLGLAGISEGYFVEFGAWDGKHLSNSALLAEKGWAGCFIEGDVVRFQDLLTNYGKNSKISPVNAYVTSNGGNSLDEILKRVKAPKEITLLSIDIDGNDYHVWAALKEFSALLCVIEFNPTIPADVVFVQDNNLELNFGNSLAALWELSVAKGYALVAATDWNAFFMPKTICDKYSIPVYLPMQVKSTKYESAFFQGYNGKIIVDGFNELLWHGIKFDNDKFQLLPKALQEIPAGQNEKYYKEFHSFKSKLSDKTKVVY